MLHLSSRNLRGLARIRKFHSSPVTRINPNDVEEVKIPVPWGHIAGKWWGRRDQQPILALHGWLDNAASWDPFASVLPDCYSLLAIDMPGNGLSSPIPPFHNYYYIDTLPIIKTIKSYFDFKERLHLLGHSLGSAVCFMYSALHPKDVVSYFGIDYVIYGYADEDKRAKEIGKIIDRKIDLALRDSNASKQYTREEAKKSWIQATNNSLSPKSAEILMERGVKELPNGMVIFNIDQRLKGSDIYSFNANQVYRFTENIKCDVCLIKAKQSKIFDQGSGHLPELLEKLSASARSFEFHEIDAKHHLHMDFPETIVEKYEQFRAKINN